MFQLIVTGEVEFPDFIEISSECKDIIKKLLIKNYHKRLGYEKGLNEIKQHPWFKGFSFDALEKMEMKPP